MIRKYRRFHESSSLKDILEEVFGDMLLEISIKTDGIRIAGISNANIGIIGNMIGFWNDSDGDNMMIPANKIVDIYEDNGIEIKLDSNVIFNIACETKREHNKVTKSLKEYGIL